MAYSRHGVQHGKDARRLTSYRIIQLLQAPWSRWYTPLICTIVKAPTNQADSLECVLIVMLLVDAQQTTNWERFTSCFFC